MEALAKIDQALCARGDVFLGHPVLRTMVAPSYTQDAKAVSAQSMMLVALTSVAAIIAYVAGNGVNPVRFCTVPFRLLCSATPETAAGSLLQQWKDE